MTLELYRTAVDMSDAGRQARLFDGLPHDVGGLARIVQGLLMHQHVSPAYGVRLSEAKLAEPHIRGVEPMLDRIVAHDAKPLSQPRPESERLVGVCRHFTLLHVAMLRRQGMAARARCGFGAYFQADKLLDHWVTEYWNEAEQRWILVDAQLDARQRELFGVAFDPLDVPRDQFVVAGDAWRLCRGGEFVLFHDRSAHGPGHPEIHGSGLSLLRGVVPLPHARARLLLDDAPRMSVFARRFAPARCVLLEHGTRIDTSSDGIWPPGMRVLAPDGHVTTGEAA